jgi:uncharacterized protein YndB with AHSA1/START domain
MPAENGRYSLSVDTLIDAGAKEAWETLTDPAKVGKLFWGSTVESDFVPGHPIVWKGTWEGKPFEDRGTIRKVAKGSLLQNTHWTPSSGPDTEENRSLLTWSLTAEGDGVRVTLRHENIPTEAMRDHSMQMWNQLLARMKEMLEKRTIPR